MTGRAETTRPALGIRRSSPIAQAARAFAGLTLFLGRVDARTAAAFFLPLLVYLVSLAPTIYNLDSAELTTAAATGGVVRSTGYPLYLLLGRAWSLIPVGDVGYRMNLFSAVAAALAIALTDRILRRLGVGALAGMAALGLLATSVYYWSLSVFAEVYALQSALTALIILLAFRWREQQTMARFLLLAVTLGLALAHHGSVRLVAVALAVYVLLVAGRDAYRRPLIPVGAFGAALGLLVFTYLPVAQDSTPAFNYAGIYDANAVFHPFNLASPGELIWFVSGSAFGRQMFGYTPVEWLAEVWVFAGDLWRSFLGVGIGPAVLGAILVFKSDRKTAWFLSLAFVLHVLFFTGYRVVDKDTMFLPAYLIWAVWLAVGFQWLLNWVSTPGAHIRELRAVQTAMIGAVALSVFVNAPVASRAGDWSAREHGETILAALEPDAVLFGWWETVPVVQYLQLVEGQRADVLAINRFLMAPVDQLRYAEVMAGVRPIYFDSTPPNLPAVLVAEPAGPLFRVKPADQIGSPTSHETNSQPTGR